MVWGILITTLLGCMTGIPLILYGGLEMVIVGIACVVFCFLYTTLFSYHGLGDILVLLFFGIIPVCCTYYVCMPLHQQIPTGEVIASSIACGLAIDALLIVNNYRDIDNDRSNGKITLAVRLGASKTRSAIRINRIHRCRYHDHPRILRFISNRQVHSDVCYIPYIYHITPAILSRDEKNQQGSKIKSGTRLDSP